MTYYIMDDTKIFVFFHRFLFNKNEKNTSVLFLVLIYCVELIFEIKWFWRARNLTDLQTN